MPSFWGSIPLKCAMCMFSWQMIDYSRFASRQHIALFMARHWSSSLFPCGVWQFDHLWLARELLFLCYKPVWKFPMATPPPPPPLPFLMAVCRWIKLMCPYKLSPLNCELLLSPCNLKLNEVFSPQLIMLALAAGCHSGTSLIWISIGDISIPGMASCTIVQPNNLERSTVLYIVFPIQRHGWLLMVVYSCHRINSLKPSVLAVNYVICPGKKLTVNSMSKN